MLMQVKLNGASDLIINLTTENVEYVQDMIRMFETNVVAVQGQYSGGKIVELDTTIIVGKHVTFKGNDSSYSEPTPDLIIHAGESDSILKNYEPLPMESLISVKGQMKKLHETNTSLKKENEYLKEKVNRLEQSLEAALNGEDVSE